MNSFVDARYVESMRHLALGIEAIDAAREQPLLTPIMLTFDDAPLGNARPQIQRHVSNRHVLLYDDYYASQARDVDLRIFDQRERLYATDADCRRFLPRRLRIALPKLADAQTQPAAARICRPYLYPGAAYPLGNVATGLRAHVMRGAAGPLPLRPARWVRVLATVPSAEPLLAASAVVGRGWGDERGEFVLLVRYHTAAIGIDSELSVRIRVFAPPEAPPPGVDLPAVDPLWDLPREQPASLAEDDAVLLGHAMPAAYTVVAQRIVPLPLGRMLRGQANFVI